jgi:hypothetical protein
MLGMAINTLPSGRVSKIVTFEIRRTQDASFRLGQSELPSRLSQHQPGRERMQPVFTFVACYDTARPSFSQNGLEIRDGISPDRSSSTAGAIPAPGRRRTSPRLRIERSVAFGSQLHPISQAPGALTTSQSSRQTRPDALLSTCLRRGRGKNRIMLGKGAEFLTARETLPSSNIAAAQTGRDRRSRLPVGGPNIR